MNDLPPPYPGIGFAGNYPSQPSGYPNQPPPSYSAGIPGQPQSGGAGGYSGQPASGPGPSYPTLPPQNFGFNSPSAPSKKKSSKILQKILNFIFSFSDKRTRSCCFSIL